MATSDINLGRDFMMTSNLVLSLLLLMAATFVGEVDS